MCIRDSTNIHSKTVLKTVDLLESLKIRCKTLTIAWIKAHIGHEGNEQADQAAKEGTEAYQSEIYLPKSWINTKNIINNLMIAEWNERWMNSTEYKHTKFFYPEVDTHRAKHLLKHSRSTVQLLTRAITGHNFLAKHQNRIGETVAPECRVLARCEYIHDK